MLGATRGAAVVPGADERDAAAARGAEVAGATTFGAMLVDTATLVTTTDDTGTVDSASTAGTALSDDPEAQTRSSISNGRHTMVATTASVNERCEDAGVEDRTKTFGRG